MSPDLLDLLLQAAARPLVMAAAAAAISLLAGLPLGMALILGDSYVLSPRPVLRESRDHAPSGLRSAPFLIPLIAAIPLTRLALGSSLGLAAILPLGIGGTIYFARLVQIALGQVDRGLIDTGLAIGASRGEILRHFLLPEALAGILASFAVTVIILLGAAVISTAIGARVLDDLAARAGVQPLEAATILILVVTAAALLYLLRLGGEGLSRRRS